MPGITLCLLCNHRSEATHAEFQTMRKKSVSHPNANFSLIKNSLKCKQLFIRFGNWWRDYTGILKNNHANAQCQRNDIDLSRTIWLLFEFDGSRMGGRFFVTLCQFKIDAIFEITQIWFLDHFLNTIDKSLWCWLYGMF